MSGWYVLLVALLFYVFCWDKVPWIFFWWDGGEVEMKSFDSKSAATMIIDEWWLIVSQYLFDGWNVSALVFSNVEK